MVPCFDSRCMLENSNIFADKNKQGSFVTWVLSAASAAFSANAYYEFISRDISLPPYSTYVQSFIFRPVAFPEILVDEKPY